MPPLQGNVMPTKPESHLDLSKDISYAGRSREPFQPLEGYVVLAINWSHATSALK